MESSRWLATVSARLLTCENLAWFSCVRLYRVVPNTTKFLRNIKFWTKLYFTYYNADWNKFHFIHCLLKGCKFARSKIWAKNVFHYSLIDLAITSRIWYGIEKLSKILSFMWCKNISHFTYWKKHVCFKMSKYFNEWNESYFH